MKAEQISPAEGGHQIPGEGGLAFDVVGRAHQLGLRKAFRLPIIQELVVCIPGGHIFNMCPWRDESMLGYPGDAVSAGVWIIKDWESISSMLGL